MVRIAIQKGPSEATLKMTPTPSLVVGRHIITMMMIQLEMVALEITNTIFILEIGIIEVSMRQKRLLMEKMDKLIEIVIEQLSLLGKNTLMYRISTCHKI